MFPVIMALASLAGAPQPVPSKCSVGDDALAEVLAAHEHAREAHLKGDASLMAKGTADILVSASNGRISRQSRADVVSFFTGYFGRVKYLEWSDAAPPIVELSGDGHSAWMAVGIQARLKQRTGPDAKESAFRSSWVATYRRAPDCTWQMTSIASDVVPEN